MKVNNINFQNKCFSMRTALDEAKNLLQNNEIDLLEYRKLIKILLLEVSELDRHLKSEEIRNILFKIVNRDR